MPSTYTPNLNLELIATGEQDGTWGETTNDNLELIDTAAAVAEDNSTAITAIESAQATQDAAIATNASGIATNTGAIATNASGIATNTSAIATNASGIATNTGAIATNTSGIAANLAKNDAQDAIIVQIYGGLVTNNGLIATNTAAIALNTANAATAQTTANTGVTNAATAQTTADAALPKTGGTVTGSITFNDGHGLYFGTGNDAVFFCNGSILYTDLGSEIDSWQIRDGSTLRYTFDDNGSFTATGNITAYSDIRIKADIELIPDAVNKVKQLRGVTFLRSDAKEKDADVRHTGVIAQEVLEVLPEAVIENEEGMYSVAYGNMVGLLIEAIKEQQVQIDELKAAK